MKEKGMIKQRSKTWLIIGSLVHLGSLESGKDTAVVGYFREGHPTPAVLIWLTLEPELEGDAEYNDL